MGATTGAPAKGLTNGELVLQAGGVVAIALGLPYVPLVLGLIRARKSFGQLVKNVHDATREDPADRKHPKLDLEALEVANVRTGLQPKVLRPLDAAKAAKRETG